VFFAELSLATICSECGPFVAAGVVAAGIHYVYHAWLFVFFAELRFATLCPKYAMFVASGVVAAGTLDVHHSGMPVRTAKFSLPSLYRKITPSGAVK